MWHFLVGLILIYLIYLLQEDLVKFNQLVKEKDLLKKYIEIRKQEKVFYTKRLNELDNFAYIEKEARKRLGLIKKGEVVFKSWPLRSDQ